MARLSEYVPESEDEAQIITNLLVPYLKRGATKSAAYLVFQRYRGFHIALQYPQELTNSKLQLRNRKDELIGPQNQRSFLGTKLLRLFSSWSSWKTVLSVILAAFFFVAFILRWSAGQGSELAAPMAARNSTSQVNTSPAGGFSQLQASANQGNADAQALLGEMYYQGKSLQRDDKEAISWLYKAANQGNASAQFRIGYMNDVGDGTTKNKKEAFKWYSKAAGQGEPRSQYIIGYSYAYGIDLMQNSVQAYLWFEIARLRGAVGATSSRDVVGSWLTPQQIAEAQMVAQNWKPKTPLETIGASSVVRV